MTNEYAWRTYVLDYDIEVDEERVEQELSLVRADMKHRMMYAHMSGGEMHPFPEMELAQQEDELREAALFEAKEPLVLKDLATKLQVAVTPEELQAEAEALAEREGSSLEMLRKFFGDDFSLLERDVRDRKIREWALSQQ
ncbi:MAG: hypothetical protein IJ781_03375 [Atopobiaceae bacterium]|nr:hypothetical protein [Atopobiaceae bacterium]